MMTNFAAKARRIPPGAKAAFFRAFGKHDSELRMRFAILMGGAEPEVQRKYANSMKGRLVDYTALALLSSGKITDIEAFGTILCSVKGTGNFLAAIANEYSKSDWRLESKRQVLLSEIRERSLGMVADRLVSHIAHCGENVLGKSESMQLDVWMDELGKGMKPEALIATLVKIGYVKCKRPLAFLSDSEFFSGSAPIRLADVILRRWDNGAQGSDEAAAGILDEIFHRMKINEVLGILTRRKDATFQKFVLGSMFGNGFAPIDIDAGLVKVLDNKPDLLAHETQDAIAEIVGSFGLAKIAIHSRKGGHDGMNDAVRGLTRWFETQ